MWTASFVFTLARETGWPEHLIFWELPLARLLQYQHCALRAYDVWTVPVSPPADAQFDRLLTGWMLGGETLGVVQIVGCVAIAAGVALAQFGGGVAPEVDTGFAEGG